jgi:cell division protein FtsQ
MLQAKALPGERAPVKRQRKLEHGATRKIALEQKQPRSFAWLNRLLILLGVGIVLVATVKAALVLHAIPVERIVVTGKLEHTQTLALQDMVQPALVGGFLSADLQRIREQLESLPWVYEAFVKRQWPNALEIHVVEQLPIARWGEDAFLNHEGAVFQSTSAENGGSLPRLTGPSGTEQKLIGNYQLITESLLPAELTVEGLVVDERGQLRITLAGGMEVIFGDQDLLARLDRFVALYRADLAGQKADVRRVDMRYESGIAVAFNEPPEVAGI